MRVCSTPHLKATELPSQQGFIFFSFQGMLNVWLILGFIEERKFLHQPTSLTVLSAMVFTAPRKGAPASRWL